MGFNNHGVDMFNKRQSGGNGNIKSGHEEQLDKILPFSENLGKTAVPDKLMCWH